MPPVLRKRKKTAENYDPREGPSTMIDTAPASTEIYADSRSFGNLPDVVLIKVFSYLSFEDRCNAALAYRRWYEVSRSSVFWSKRDVNAKNGLHALKSVLILPPTVTHLNIKRDSFDRLFPLWLPDIFTSLHERCPGIKTLTIENLFFADRFCDAVTTDHILMHSFEAASGSKRRRCILECCNKKNDCDKFVPENQLRELCLFSVRNAHIFLSLLSSQISQFLPDIKILDLTCSANINPTAIPFLLKLQQLQELYLVECTVSNTALKTLLKNSSLKVLDLEGSHKTDDNTFTVLQKYGHSFEELFLGNTDIVSFELKEGSFPNLQKICLKNTKIRKVADIMRKIPSLHSIDISFCDRDSYPAVILLYLVTEFLGRIRRRDTTPLRPLELQISGDGVPTELCHHRRPELQISEDGVPTELCHHFRKKHM